MCLQLASDIVLILVVTTKYRVTSLLMTQCSTHLISEVHLKYTMLYG